MTSAAIVEETVARRPRRDDVQGLRAIASLLVASYHIWFGTVSGGVDVFFVLGGYLLVTSIVDEVERSGRHDAPAALRRQAAGMKGIHFTGRVPHEEVERYYSLIDLLAYPRKASRLTELVTPLKPLEAMAQGRIVAASSIA